MELLPKCKEVMATGITRSMAMCCALCKTPRGGKAAPTGRLCWKPPVRLQLLIHNCQFHNPGIGSRSMSGWRPPLHAETNCGMTMIA